MVLIIFSVFIQSRNPESYTVMLVDEDQSKESILMVEYISNTTSEFSPWFNVIKIDTYEEAIQKLYSYEYLGLIYIPKGFHDNLTANNPNIKGNVLLFVQNINNDYVKNYIQRLDEVILTFNQDMHLSYGHVDNFALISNKFYFIDQQLNHQKGITVGIIGMYGILCGLGYGSVNIAREYEEKTILEIINSPISKTAYIASKQLIGVIIGTIATTIIGVVLFLVFNINFTGNLLIVYFAYCLSTWTHAGIDCLIGLKFKRITPVILIAIILSFFLWFFSGGFAPLAILGESVVLISRIFPATYWGEILFAETFIPYIYYTLPRLLILLLMSIGITVLTWYVIKREGFKY